MNNMVSRVVGPHATHIPTILCIAARRYATAVPPKPTAKTATRTSAAIRKKTLSKAPAFTKSATVQTIGIPVRPASTYEEDSIAARTPLKKPSTSGLGVPSRSPSGTSNPPATRVHVNKNIPVASPKATNPLVGEAAAMAEKREAQLRTARLRRAEQEEQAAAKPTEEESYEEKYNTLKNKWVTGMIAMPILLVTSYILFNRLILGNQPEPIQKIDKYD